MAENAAAVGFVHVPVCHLGLARAAGRNESRPVSAGGHLAGGKRKLLPLAAALGVIHPAHNLSAVLEVILVLHLVHIALVVHVANIEERVLAIRVLADCE